MRKFEPFFEHLTEYINCKGDSFIPRNYVCEDGFKLGYYVLCVRTKYTKVTEEQKKRLDEVHFAWYGRKKGIFPETYERYFQLIQKYYQKHGNCDIPQTYQDEEHNHVGSMATYIRVKKDSLTQEQKECLEKIHFVWQYRNPRISFEEFCERHIAYEKEHGSCYIPVRYVTSDNIKLGQMARNFRYGKRLLSDEQREKLNTIGFIWNVDEYRKTHPLSYEKKNKKKKKK